MLSSKVDKITLNEFHSYLWAINVRKKSLVIKRESRILKLMLLVNILFLVALYMMNSNFYTDSFVMTFKVLVAFFIVIYAVFIMLKMNNRIDRFINFNAKEIYEIFTDIPSEITKIIYLCAVAEQKNATLEHLKARELQLSVDCLTNLFKSEDMLDECLSAVKDNDLQKASVLLVQQ